MEASTRPRRHSPTEAHFMPAHAHSGTRRHESIGHTHRVPSHATLLAAVLHDGRQPLCRLSWGVQALRVSRRQGMGREETLRAQGHGRTRRPGEERVELLLQTPSWVRAAQDSSHRQWQGIQAERAPGCPCQGRASRLPPGAPERRHCRKAAARVPKEINGVKIYPARHRDDKQAAIMVPAAPRSRGGAPKKWLVRLDDATAKWAVLAARQLASSGNDICC